MNANSHRKGSRVTILPTVQGNYLAAGFPGWGAPNYRDYLVSAQDVVAQQGTVTSVNSHGSNPWTRYSIRLDNGGRIIDAIDGKDFKWAE